ncbi:MAG: adenylate/guanylate cyclase domain-containing protein [Solirubrobacteraceae bacterium]
MTPKTQYARNGDVSIAYQVLGDGPLDLVIVPGFISHLELDWTEPLQTRFFRRLSSFSRLIRFDKRGTGLSDPVAGIPTLEERMEDVHAVLDVVGSERAVLFGWSEGGPMAVLFAATYPDRTAALVLYGTFVSGAALGPQLEQVLEVVDQRWGEGSILDLFAPSVAHEEVRRRLTGTYERASASPGMARALVEAVRRTDVTPALSAIQAPTLVLHRRDENIPVEGARETAKAIPGARLVELEGRDHLPFIGDSDAIVDEVEEFLTGARHTREPDRVLATVLFTDIVGSTERAGEMGDSRWRELLESHNALVCEQVERFDGRPVKSTGDGFLATFDGPAKAIRCASTITAEVRRLGIEVRAGIHTGECERMNGDVGGLAVHIGARVGSLAPPGHVVVSSTVRDLVAGSGIDFVERGTEVLKGVPGEWRLYSVAGPASSVASAKPIADTRGDRASDRVGVAMARRAPWIGRSIARAFMPSARKRG